MEALNGIDFTVDEGEYLFICGANGSGKSTSDIC
jgi:ABC-type multidrug transport system ATPase subunit